MSEWTNKSGARELVDCWQEGNLSYAIVLYPNGTLYLQWINVNKV